MTLPKIPRDACETSKDTQRCLEDLDISKVTQRCLETFDTSKDTQQCFERSSKDTCGCLGNWSFYKDTWRAWNNPGRQNMLWDLWNYLEQLEFLQVQTPFSWCSIIGMSRVPILDGVSIKSAPKKAQSDNTPFINDEPLTSHDFCVLARASFYCYTSHTSILGKRESWVSSPHIRWSSFEGIFFVSWGRRPQVVSESGWMPLGRVTKTFQSQWPMDESACGHCRLGRSQPHFCWTFVPPLPPLPLLSLPFQPLSPTAAPILTTNEPQCGWKVTPHSS